MRGIIYSLNLYGVGHIKRMLLLSEGFLENGDTITFLQGGQDVGLSINYPQFEHIILKDSKSKRLEQIQNLSTPYDFIIIEQIPFSKLSWFDEVLALIEPNPKALVVCSHKGTMRATGENRLDEEKHTLALLEKYFDTVLVHSDPKLITLDDSFSYTKQIADRVHYTGFISKHGNQYDEPEQREKNIVVTTGAGDKGLKLLKAIASIIHHFPEYRFMIIAGPMMSNQTKSQLQSLQEKHANMIVIDFVADFEKLLLRSSLLISLAGFTLISAYATRIPTISFPASNSENQQVVAEKFAEIPSIKFVTESDLNPKTFQEIINDTLLSPPPSTYSLNIDGVTQTVQFIKRKLYG